MTAPLLNILKSYQAINEADPISRQQLLTLIAFLTGLAIHSAPDNSAERDGLLQVMVAIRACLRLKIDERLETGVHDGKEGRQL